MLIMHEARTIKKYSMYNDKLPQIIQYLDEVLIPELHKDTTFIGDILLSFYFAVSRGYL